MTKDSTKPFTDEFLLCLIECLNNSEKVQLIEDSLTQLVKGHQPSIFDSGDFDEDEEHDEEYQDEEILNEFLLGSFPYYDRFLDQFDDYVREWVRSAVLDSQTAFDMLFNLSSCGTTEEELTLNLSRWYLEYHIEQYDGILWDIEEIDKNYGIYGWTLEHEKFVQLEFVRILEKWRGNLIQKLRKMSQTAGETA